LGEAGKGAYNDQIIDIVLFSCMFTFVTGIVLAAHMFWDNGGEAMIGRWIKPRVSVEAE
jgi:hypothetical protein